MIHTSRFGQIWQSVSVEGLSVFVDSAGLLVSRAYQFLADFCMLTLGMRFPSLQPAVFWYLFLHPHVPVEPFTQTHTEGAFMTWSSVSR